MKVRATAIGYYGHMRRREGDVFSIPDQPRRKVRKAEELSADGKRRFRPDSAAVQALADKDGTIPAAYSASWMEPVSGRVPERTTSAPQALKKHHDTVIAERAQAQGGQQAQAATADADVI